MVAHCKLLIDCCNALYYNGTYMSKERISDQILEIAEDKLCDVRYGLAGSVIAIRSNCDAGQRTRYMTPEWRSDYRDPFREELIECGARIVGECVIPKHEYYTGALKINRWGIANGYFVLVETRKEDYPIPSEPNGHVEEDPRMGDDYLEVVLAPRVRAGLFGRDPYKFLIDLAGWGAIAIRNLNSTSIQLTPITSWKARGLTDLRVNAERDYHS